MKYACKWLLSLEYRLFDAMTKSILKDPSIRQKAIALLSGMNLDQKIGQMTLTERLSISPEEVRTFHIGALLSGSDSFPEGNLPTNWVAMSDAYWAASMAQDEQHLAVPILHGIHAVHGNNNVGGATIFPHNIGLGATNDRELVKKVAMVTTREILAAGVEWTFAPSLAVARNIQWGRTYESFSEDTGLVASYAEGFVQGLQGNLETDSVIACVKSWVGDGGTTHGIDQGETTLGKSELESNYIRPYRHAINAGALTVMASFNSWNGEKCHGHKYLVTDVLKGELQFDGFIVSDLDGIDYLSEDYYNAVAVAVNAGIDMFMVSEKWKEFIDHLKLHIKRGSVSMQRIDDAVQRILMVKFAYGLFDRPRPADRFWSNHEGFGGEEHRAVAREAVRKSLVLLKNDGPVLPLDKQARVLVAGKNANNRGHQCGGFTMTWQGLSGNDHLNGATSVWEGISQVASNAVLSTCAFGTDADPELHDVAIIVIGERPYAEGLGDVRPSDQVIVEAGSLIKGSMNVRDPYGSTLELASLHPEDLRTIKTITDRGIPAVVVMVSGRPLVVNRELAACSAFIAAWLPGSEGQGVADVLFGDFDFQGRLPFSWPDSNEGQLTGGQSDRVALFPSGYGMTYSNRRPDQRSRRLSA